MRNKTCFLWLMLTTVLLLAMHQVGIGGSYAYPVSVKDADLIVIGEVSNVVYQFPDDPEKCRTVATLTVREILKGEPAGTEVQFSMFGSVVGNKILHNGGDPIVLKDDRVVAFLRLHDDGVYRLLDGKGSYRLIVDNIVVYAGISVDQYKAHLKEALKD